MYMSRPSWACELKSDEPQVTTIEIESRPSWACELKYIRCSIFGAGYVTPLVGV